MGNNNYPYLADEVFNASRGHYVELAQRFLGDYLGKALVCPGRHVPDPWKGGHAKDGMRLDRDFNETGKTFFNSNIWGHSGCMINFMQLCLYAGVAPTSGKYFEMVGDFLRLPRHDGKNGCALLTEREMAELKARQEAQRALYEKQQQELLIKESATNRARNQKLWENAVPLFINGQPNPVAADAFEYFKARGLDGVKAHPEAFANLRFAKSLTYREGEVVKGQFNTLLSRVQSPSGETVSLHRTFLYHGNKAPVDQAKKLTPADRMVSSSSRYIQIGGPVTDGIIGIAEGIETALSCFLATGIPTWSAVCAQNLKVFEAPQNVHTVLVFADKDANGVGQEAAKALQAKLKAEGILCSVILPKPELSQGVKGIDWNDEWKRAGKTAFPAPEVIHKWVMERIRFFIRQGYTQPAAQPAA